MPAKNIVKIFAPNNYYHIYNRGVEKRNIFLDSQDCSMFLHYLKVYLAPKQEIMELAVVDKKLLRFIQFNLYDEVDLVSFSLMPNHFHLLVFQKSQNGITKLMKRVITGYVMYFNRKYERVGTLFQNIYKAALIADNSHLLHITRYIHLNPLELPQTSFLHSFTSYQYFLDYAKASWIKPDEILKLFGTDTETSRQKYKLFIEEAKLSSLKSDSKNILGAFTLED